MVFLDLVRKSEYVLLLKPIFISMSIAFEALPAFVLLASLASFFDFLVLRLVCYCFAYFCA